MKHRTSASIFNFLLLVTYVAGQNKEQWPLDIHGEGSPSFYRCLYVFFICTDYVGTWPDNKFNCYEYYRDCLSKSPTQDSNFILDEEVIPIDVSQDQFPTSEISPSEGNNEATDENSNPPNDGNNNNNQNNNPNEENLNGGNPDGGNPNDNDPNGSNNSNPNGPDPSNPDPSNPDPNNPDPSNPDSSNPDPSNSDPSNPNPSNPDPSNPGSSNPDPNNPDSSNPDSSNPDPSNPGSSIPDDGNQSEGNQDGGNPDGDVGESVEDNDGLGNNNSSGNNPGNQNNGSDSNDGSNDGNNNGNNDGNNTGNSDGNNNGNNNDNINNNSNNNNNNDNNNGNNNNNNNAGEDIPETDFVQDTGVRSCHQHLLGGALESGEYIINLRGQQVTVYCDMVTEGGGWTILQRRGDYGRGKNFFLRSWDDYKKGFGDPMEDFWLGLNNMHQLTKNDEVELLIELEDFENNRTSLLVNNFTIGSEANGFKISYKNYNSKIGNSLPARGTKFSTIDMDNDAWKENCAKRFSGAWWYSACHNSNLNGLYLEGKHESFGNGVNWYHWKGYHYSLKNTEMKVRPTRAAEVAPVSDSF